ncbi:methionine synthase [Methanobacterium sp.]|uniref:methionine synthase n=1 Tax=Methanobacterium sp. TaxID=2164 RepID=UPI003C781DCA
MLTTVVGSYPAILKKPSSFSDKISNVLGTYDEYKHAVELAVRDQISAGIDIISDGQVRDGMVEIFASSIYGMAVEENISKIVGKIMPSPKSICAKDLKFAIKVAQGISKEYGQKPKKTLEGNIKGVKGIITGPSTLVFSSRIEGYYDEKEDAVLDLAHALNKEAEHLENAGAVVVQIDEPFISTGVVDINVAKKAVEIVADSLSVPVSLHVCGEVADIFDKLLKFSVDIVDCEFAGIDGNINALENANLRGKKIGFGCLDTKTDKIETKEEVENLIKMGADFIGAENMLADPDCGMRMRSRDAAFSKLKVMTQVAKEF